jgi:hypothetical protein
MGAGRLSKPRIYIRTVYDCTFCGFSEIMAEGDDLTSGWRRASFTGRPEDKEYIRCKLNPRARWRPLWKKSGWRPPRSCMLIEAPPVVRHLVPERRLNQVYVPELKLRDDILITNADGSEDEETTAKLWSLTG